jgi:hypothetical protein
MLRPTRSSARAGWIISAQPALFINHYDGVARMIAAHEAPKSGLKHDV